MKKGVSEEKSGKKESGKDVSGEKESGEEGEKVRI